MKNLNLVSNRNSVKKYDIDLLTIAGFHMTSLKFKLKNSKILRPKKMVLSLVFKFWQVRH